jgi:hypothetical protein
MLVAFAVAILAAAGTTGSAAANGERAPLGAYVVAYERALHHFENPDRVRVNGGTLRSVLDPSWSLVNGTYGNRRLWSAWVRRTAAGRYRVEAFRTRRFDPGPPVPCDIRPSWSEPAC